MHGRNSLAPYSALSRTRPPVGFETLAEEMEKNPKSLMRMLSNKGNPRADNLLAMVARLKQREGVSFSLTLNNGFHA